LITVIVGPVYAIISIIEFINLI